MESQNNKNIKSSLYNKEPIFDSKGNHHIGCECNTCLKINETCLKHLGHSYKGLSEREIEIVKERNYARWEYLESKYGDPLSRVDVNDIKEGLK